MSRPSGKLREGIAQLPMVSIPVNCLFSSGLHPWPHGSPLTSWQRKRRLGPGWQMILHNIQAPPKSGQLWQYSPFWDILKDNGEGQSSLWTERSAPGCYPRNLLGRRNGQVFFIYQFTGYGQWFGWVVRDLEEAWLENWWEGNWSEGRGKWTEPYKWAKNWRYLWTIWILPKGWPQQRKILIIKWLGEPILWISFSLFPQPPLGSWTKWPQWQGWRLCTGSATGTSTS